MEDDLRRKISGDLVRFMNGGLNAYHQRARELIGDRTPAEIKCDDAVIAGLASGMNLPQAIATANREYPDAARQSKSDQWGDWAARYDFIRQHRKFPQPPETKASPR
jgi:retron-type reverse transcriptase